MKDALTILRFLRDAADRGDRGVLVTLTDVTGGSSRAPGTHMAVSADGAHMGSLSGGCIEAAVAAEALAVLERGTAALVRFGAGSRYIDIRLPCGGGIDLLFTPDPPAPVIAGAIARLEARRPVSMVLGQGGGATLAADGAQGWSGTDFAVTHVPDLRIIILGQGAEAGALARLGIAYGAEVELLSPDAATLAAGEAAGARTGRLLSPSSVQPLAADAHSAVVFLFHDHDWEPALMAAALASPAFFIGAMGSEQTHARRAAMLDGRGVAAHDIARIAGPVGLIPATRDPDTLALSVLAQIAQALSRPDEHDSIMKSMNTAHGGRRC